MRDYEAIRLQKGLPEEVWTLERNRDLFIPAIPTEAEYDGEMKFYREIKKEMPHLEYLCLVWQSLELAELWVNQLMDTFNDVAITRVKTVQFLKDMEGIVAKNDNIATVFLKCDNLAEGNLTINLWADDGTGPMKLCTNTHNSPDRYYYPN